jgi:hypothetical protein
MIRATDFRNGKLLVYDSQAHLLIAAKHRPAVIHGECWQH